MKTVKGYQVYTSNGKATNQIYAKECDADESARSIDGYVVETKCFGF